MNGGTVGARHHADDPNVGRQRALPSRFEQALRAEFLLERLESREQRASARGTRPVRHELEATPRSPDRRAPANLNASPFHEVPASAQRLTPIHDALEAGVFAFVFQREVVVAGGVLLQVRDLARDPEARERALEVELDLPGELGDRVDASPRVGAGLRLTAHREEGKNAKAQRRKKKDAKESPGISRSSRLCLENRLPDKGDKGIEGDRGMETQVFETLFIPMSPLSPYPLLTPEPVSI